MWSENSCFKDIFLLTILVFLHLGDVPKLSSYAKAEDKLFRHLFGSYQKWVRPVDHLNRTIRVKFGLAISQLVDVVRTGKAIYNDMRSCLNDVSVKCMQKILV